jgi:hypothetical protein
MNDLQRSVKTQNPPTSSRLLSVQMGRKAAICFVALLIVSVMIVWFGFLGWGVVAILQWVLDCARNFWTTYL